MELRSSIDEVISEKKVQASEDITDRLSPISFDTKSKGSTAKISSDVYSKSSGYAKTSTGFNYSSAGAPQISRNMNYGGVIIESFFAIRAYAKNMGKKLNNYVAQHMPKY